MTEKCKNEFGGEDNDRKNDVAVYGCGDFGETFQPIPSLRVLLTSTGQSSVAKAWECSERSLMSTYIRIILCDSFAIVLSFSN